MTAARRLAAIVDVVGYSRLMARTRTGRSRGSGRDPASLQRQGIDLRQIGREQQYFDDGATESSIAEAGVFGRDQRDR